MEHVVCIVFERNKSTLVIGYQQNLDTQYISKRRTTTPNASVD